MKTLSWRLVVSIVVLLGALVYLLPTLEMKINNRQKPKLWPGKTIVRGLDLQGGMHLTLEVEVDKAVAGTVDRLTEDLKDWMKKERIRYREVRREGIARIIVVLRNVEGKNYAEAFEKLLSKEFEDLRIVSRPVPGASEKMYVLDLPEKADGVMGGRTLNQEDIRKMAVSQALETIRNRVDQFGVSEPDIRRQGDTRILIQLPGVKDTQRAKELIGKTALLEFKLVDEINDPNEAEKTGKTPPGTELLYQVIKNRNTNQETKIPYLLKKRTLLTGAYLTDARVQFDRMNNAPYVTIKFDKKGARIFEKITGENVKKRLAIVLDNHVYSAPEIQERISGGEARITGSFTDEEARDLAIVLRAGALPAPVKILEERTVGPSLGRDSIRMGTLSMIVGGILVILFMVIYYRLSGVIADMALFFNVVLIMGGLAAFQATLTLPGIAGIILTIGMAVDANVLIFERIREEYRLGKTPHAAVSAGFDRATLTIMDANVTTLIAALVLLQFGTGPVRGFAVTLSLGVVASLFTSLILSRAIFDFLFVNRKMKTLSI